MLCKNAMIEVSISNELKAVNPTMALGVMECKVLNTSYNEGLWSEIDALTAEIRSTLTPYH